MKTAAKSILYRIVAGIGIIALVIFRYATPRISRSEGREIEAGATSFIWYLLAFLSCILLSSAVIDYIRLETNWLPLIKGIAYIVIFLITFIAFLLAIFVLEYLRFN